MWPIHGEHFLLCWCHQRGSGLEWPKKRLRKGNQYLYCFLQVRSKVSPFRYQPQTYISHCCCYTKLYRFLHFHMVRVSGHRHRVWHKPLDQALFQNRDSARHKDIESITPTLAYPVSTCQPEIDERAVVVYIYESIDRYAMEQKSCLLMG